MAINMSFKSEYCVTCDLYNIFTSMSVNFRSEINVKSITATLVVWLQNDNGFGMYKPSDTAIDAFLESYRPGRDKNTETVATEITITTNNNSENNKSTT